MVTLQATISFWMLIKVILSVLGSVVFVVGTIWTIYRAFSRKADVKDLKELDKKVQNNIMEVCTLKQMILEYETKHVIEMNQVKEAVAAYQMKRLEVDAAIKMGFHNEVAAIRTEVKAISDNINEMSRKIIDLYEEKIKIYESKRKGVQPNQKV